LLSTASRASGGSAVRQGRRRVAPLAGGGLLSELPGAPSTFLRGIGVMCLAHAGANTLWVAASALLLVFGWLPLTQPGVALAIANQIARSVPSSRGQAAHEQKRAVSRRPR
jgi:hypothetical protein